VSRVEERFRWVIEVEKVPGGGTAGVRAVF
jgi:hypothetical protein